MHEPNRLIPRSFSTWPWVSTLAIVALTVSTSEARACTDDKDCKGDRICDRSVCKSPRVTKLEPTPLSATAPAAPATASPPPPLVMIETLPTPTPPPTPPSSAAQTAAAAATPTASEILPSHPEPRGDGAYAPAVGFRCLVGQSACAFQLRPLEINWTHVDLHGDVLLGGLNGGDFGLGAGTRHWRVGGETSPFGMVFRWDDELVVVSNSNAGVSLLTVGLDTGPRLGFSAAVSRDMALEATLNGGLFLGYGLALNGGANQWMLSGYAGLLLGARM
jgi:hypothetical protein